MGNLSNVACFTVKSPSKPELQGEIIKNALSNEMSGVTELQVNGTNQEISGTRGHVPENLGRRTVVY